MKKKYLYSLLALAVASACHAETFPAPVGPSQSDFGGVGPAANADRTHGADRGVQRELSR